MEFIENYTSVVELERGIRNGWLWDWLNECCKRGIEFKHWCRKINKPGCCYCTICDINIIYGSSGKKALQKHANRQDHIDADRALQSSSRLDSIPTCQSLQDGTSEVKAVTSLFLSQHCLPFSLGPELLKYAQRLSKVQNKSALDSTTLSHTSATYTTTHGVAADIKERLSNSLSDRFVSLNVDEATNASGNKVLNVLVQYFCEDQQKVMIDLIGSKQENIATAENLTKMINEVLLERGVCLDRVISVLMDNCAVMRGKRGGVETKLRELNPNIMDVSGDTVHTVNNAAKKLFSVLENKFVSFQALCSDLFYDIEDSPKLRSLFLDLQAIILKKKKSIHRPMPTRFLQMRDVAVRLSELWDCLLIFYSCFVTRGEKADSDRMRKAKMEEMKLSKDEIEEVERIVSVVSKHSSSDPGKARKDRIINGIIDNQTKTTLTMKMYIGILGLFQGYVKKFQSKKPMCHILHFELFKVVKSLFSCFISSEHLPDFNVVKLSKLDFTDTQLHVKDRHLCVGPEAYLTLQRCLKDQRKHQWLNSFFAALKEGYIEAAKMMRKLPLNNDNLKHLVYLDPCNQRSEYTLDAFIFLAKQLPNVIKKEELGALDAEIRQYATDDDISLIDADSTDEDFRLDTTWWTPIFQLKSQNGSPRYQLLSRLVKALLSIFCGPIIEGTFNIMGDIIEEDRTRLTQFNHESLAIIKSFLDARKINSVDVDITRSMLKKVSGSYAAYSKYLESKSSHKVKDKDPLSNDPQPISKPSVHSELPISNQPSSANSSTSTCGPSSHLSDHQAVKRKQGTLSGFFVKRPRKE